jgi:hypothetical protein
MRTRDEPFSEVVISELKEDIIAMATAAGWDEHIVEMPDGWIAVGFSKNQ